MDRVIPVVVINDVNEVEGVLGAIRDGGIGCAEISLRTPCATEAIRLGTSLYPDMRIGAGTVINAARCHEALKAGAKFIVSPGFSDEVAAICRWDNVDYYPGCITPTEMMHALDEGISAVQYFPAELYGGIDAIRALSAVFPQMSFIPTGGINMGNLADYLADGHVAAVSGSFIMKGNITENCKAIVALCESLRSGK